MAETSNGGNVPVEPTPPPEPLEPIRIRRGQIEDLPRDPALNQEFIVTVRRIPGDESTRYDWARLMPLSST